MVAALSTSALGGTPTAHRIAPALSARLTAREFSPRYALLRRHSRARDQITSLHARSATAADSQTRLALSSGGQDVYLAVEPGRLCVVWVSSDARAGACAPAEDAAAGRGPVLFLPGPTTKIVAAVPDGATITARQTDGRVSHPKASGNAVLLDLPQASSFGWQTPDGGGVTANLAVPLG